MASKVAMGPPADRQGHRRNKSSSVLKSIIVSKNHKRSPSDGTALNPVEPAACKLASNVPKPGVLLPPDHPHFGQRAPGGPQTIPSNPPSPRKSQDVKERPSRGLHKKTLSSVSLKSLTRDKDKAKENQREPSRVREDSRDAEKPKKIKSSGNLASMFQKRSTKDEYNTPGGPKDKENTTPPSSANQTGTPRTPIWAEFSQQPFEEVTTTSKVPLNDRRSIEEEIIRFTPANYSPSKQRNFFEYGHQPSLQKRSNIKERPKSMLPASASTTSFFDAVSRKSSDERVPLGITKGNEMREKEAPRSKSFGARALLKRNNTDEPKTKTKEDATKKADKTLKKGSRVMQAVAVFNGKAKETGASTGGPVKLDPRVVEAEFEAVLESRNIPQFQRLAMRTCALEVKADFVRTSKLEPQGSRTTSAHSSIGETGGNKSTKSSLDKSPKSRQGSAEEPKVSQQDDKAGSTKRERPRSRTFTWSKADSPTKKQKPEAGTGEGKSSRPLQIPKSPSTRSLVSNGSQRSAKGPKTALPDEFVEYMKKTTKPQDVEVGKIHKLRLLLRNETVEWVDTFVQEGGMTELVALLHRIMDVEWREEHEDTLLHEVLRCLKGLCTADSALKQLADIAPLLFPALLAMLFDDEHKGPSEFTTRELIVQLLFAHLTAAPETGIQERTTELLKYLKDPVKEKETSTIPFILEMRQSRPYQIWCREITNVTKEVFWIFIHHLTVVPLPQMSPEADKLPYLKKHFPGPRAIVPAAPYVGGVEWDATNYIATHIDLINGLLASLPTKESRNKLRTEFQVSGFEKLMGQLRACNPKYYGAVHDALKVWIGAALEDGWDVKPVRMGPSDGKPPGSPVKSPNKSPKKVEKAPQLQAPKMDLGLGLDMKFEKEIGGPVKKEIDDWI